MFDKNSKNTPTNISSKISNIPLNINEEPLKRTVDMLRNDIISFKTEISKKIELLENSINILDEDYFELKEKLTASTKTKLTPNKDTYEEPKNNKNEINKNDIETKMVELEKTVKDLFVFGKLALKNHESINNLKKIIEEIKKTPKELILNNDTDFELERFTKLEKEMDFLKNNQIHLSDE